MKTQKKWFFFLHYGIVNLLLNLYPFFIIHVSYENQSHIGNALHQPIYLILWAISSAYGFYYYSKILWEHYHIPYHKKIHLILCGGLVLSCIIPYSNDLFFLINDLHVWIAVLCTVGVSLEWLRILFHPILNFDSFFRKFYFLLLLFFSISAMLFFIYGSVNSLCEITFSFFVNLILGIWISIQ